MHILKRFAYSQVSFINLLIYFLFIYLFFLFQFSDEFCISLVSSMMKNNRNFNPNLPQYNSIFTYITRPCGIRFNQTKLIEVIRRTVNNVLIMIRSCDDYVSSVVSCILWVFRERHSLVHWSFDKSVTHSRPCAFPSTELAPFKLTFTYARI